MVDAVLKEDADSKPTFNLWCRYSLVDFGLLAIALWAMIVKLGI